MIRILVLFLQSQVSDRSISLKFPVVIVAVVVVASVVVVVAVAQALWHAGAEHSHHPMVGIASNMG
jgi:hypothetical protein